MKRAWMAGCLLALSTLFGHGVSAADELPPVKMGFYLPAIRDANLADLKISLAIWAAEIAKPYGVKVHTASYRDMSAMRRALEEHDLNFINAPGMELVELFNPKEIREGYARRHNGIDEGLALVVTKASSLRNFGDLRGKRVSRLSDDRLSEVYLETQCLKVSGVDCKDFLALSEVKRDILSVYNVFFGRVDAALVSLPALRTAEDLNPQVAERLQVIQDWKAPALTYGMMTNHTDPAYRSLILNSVREALKTSRGKQMLELFKTDYLEPVDTDALKPYRALLKEYHGLLKTRAVNKR